MISFTVNNCNNMVKVLGASEVYTHITYLDWLRKVVSEVMML